MIQISKDFYAKMVGLMQVARPIKVEAFVNNDGHVEFTVGDKPAANPTMTISHFNMLTANEILIYIGVEPDASE